MAKKIQKKMLKNEAENSCVFDEVFIVENSEKNEAEFPCEKPQKKALEIADNPDKKSAEIISANLLKNPQNNSRISGNNQAKKSGDFTAENSQKNAPFKTQKTDGENLHFNPLNNGPKLPLNSTQKGGETFPSDIAEIACKGSSYARESTRAAHYSVCGRPLYSEQKNEQNYHGFGTEKTDLFLGENSPCYGEGESAFPVVDEGKNTETDKPSDGEKNTAAEMDESAQSGEEISPSKRRQFFSAKKIATMGVMTALAFVVQFLEFPLFPATPFLKLDFSDVFVMLTGFLFGPVEAAIVCLLKELLHIPFGSTGGVGELANILVLTSYFLLPSLLYRFRKGLRVVIPSLIASTLIMAALSLPVNRFINYPFFMGAGAAAMFQKTVWYLFSFNLVKGAALSLLTCLVYKSLSRFLKKFK